MPDRSKHTFILPSTNHAIKGFMSLKMWFSKATVIKQIKCDPTKSEKKMWGKCIETKCGGKCMETKCGEQNVWKQNVLKQNVGNKTCGKCKETKCERKKLSKSSQGRKSFIRIQA